MNGNGEMTGTPWIEDYGLLLYPIAITNTNSVGTVRDAIIGWGRDRMIDPSYCCLPVVAETWDGDLNDIFGFHVHREHVEAAIAAAAPGPVAGGNVGGGTGMICLGFKGGIGTSSRRSTEDDGGFTVGVLVQCNFGLRRQLRIAGVPVGQEIARTRALLRHDRKARFGAGTRALSRRQRHGAGARIDHRDRGNRRPAASSSVRRVARRAALGIGRMGGIAGMGSGDLFLAFSTAPTGTAGRATGGEGRDARGTRRSIRCTRRRCRPPKRRSPTRWWPPAR